MLRLKLDEIVLVTHSKMRERFLSFFPEHGNEMICRQIISFPYSVITCGYKSIEKQKFFDARQSTEMGKKRERSWNYSEVQDSSFKETGLLYFFFTARVII
jgi:hypothetical protein